MTKKEVLEKIDYQTRIYEHMEATIEALKSHTLALARKIYVGSSELKVSVIGDYSQFKRMKNFIEEDLGVQFSYGFAWTSGNTIIFSWKSRANRYLDLWFECHWQSVPEELSESVLNGCEPQEVDEKVSSVQIVCKRDK